jgi:hypothetical protein
LKPKSASLLGLTKTTEFGHVGNYQFDLSVVLPGAFTRNAEVSRRNFGLKPKTSFIETRGIEMRKFILIAAIGLLSTAANAGHREA